MNHNKIVQLRRSAIALRQQFVQQPGSVFSRVPGATEIAAVVAAHVNDYRERVYPPLDTLRLFIGQVLSPDRACLRLNVTKFEQHHNTFRVSLLHKRWLVQQ